MRGALAAFVCCACAAVVPLGGEARADTIEACVSAASAGQKLQKAGQLRAARAQFSACDRSQCPAEVRSVCDKLVNAVEASLPTVIFGAKDAAGGDLASVQVRVDGALVSTSMDGKAVPLDPGPHVLRFESSGNDSVDQNVVIREAEKNRLIVVTFPTAGRPGAPGAKTATGATASRPVRVPAYVFAGVGAAFLGTFVALDVDGQSRFDACQSHGCSSSAVSSLSVERVVAFGALGVGVISLGVATWLFLARPPEARAPADTKTPAWSIDAAAVAGGAGLRVGGSF